VSERLYADGIVTNNSYKIKERGISDAASALSQVRNKRDPAVYTGLAMKYATFELMRRSSRIRAKPGVDANMNCGPEIRVSRCS
jgi:hypothetical protein